MKKSALIFTAAVVLRLGIVLAFPPPDLSINDGTSWDRIAQSLLAGQGFVEYGKPTAVRPPAYPLFLASVYGIFGHSLRAARIIQAILGACTCVLIFWTGLKFLDEKTAFFGSLLSCFYPSLVIYPAIIGSEVLYTFLLALLIWVLTDALTKASLQRFLWAGILLGAANLCRSTLILFPFFLLALLFPLRANRKSILYLALATAVSFAVIAPWTLRNYRIFGGFMPVNVSSGQLFWVGTLEDSGGQYVGNEYPGYRQFDPLLGDPIAWEKAMFRAGLKNIRDKPLVFAKLTALKFYRLWFEPIGRNVLAARSPALARAYSAGHATLVLLAFWGLVCSWGKRENLWVVYALFFYFGVMHNLVAPMARFRYPIEPYLVLFAVYGASRFFRAEISAGTGL